MDEDLKDMATRLGPGKPDEYNPPDDPWAHRSVRMRCRGCMWFVQKVSPAVQRSSHIIGRCRRHAPTMNGYPVVYSDDWCGDHKMNEQVIN